MSIRSCKVCGTMTKRLVKHHTDYKNDITIDVCNSCHRMIHNGSIKGIPAPQPNNTKVGVRKSTHKRLKEHLKNYGDTMDSVIVKLLDAYEQKSE